MTNEVVSVVTPYEKFQMKAISIKQPWASMIARGRKTIETRLWPTRYRGSLLIVASKRPRIRNPQDNRRWLPTGQAIAVADLVDCQPMKRKDEKAACCECYPQAFAWFLENIRTITPFKVKGHLGLYDVPDVNFCHQCGFEIAAWENYCGECLCEEDIL